MQTEPLAKVALATLCVITAVLALATFFWATIVGAVGAVGMYVARGYKDVRGRPPYIVASTLGLPADQRQPSERV